MKGILCNVAALIRKVRSAENGQGKVRGQSIVSMRGILCTYAVLKEIARSTDNGRVGDLTDLLQK